MQALRHLRASLPPPGAQTLMGPDNNAARSRRRRGETPAVVSSGRGKSVRTAAACGRRGALRVVAFRENEQPDSDKSGGKAAERQQAAAAAAAAAGTKLGSAAAAATRSHFPPVGRGGREAVDVSGRREDEGRGPPRISSSTLAVILGGGESDRRLFPLTEKRALPAVPVGGRYRLIDVPISNCLHAGINKMFVLTQYNSQSLNKYINRAYGNREGVPNGGDGFVEVLATTQYPAGARWSEGNADAVRMMAWLLDQPRLRRIEDVLILPADQLYNADFEQLLEWHRGNDACLTVVAHGVDEGSTEDVGLLKVRPSTRELLDYVEKPRTPREREPFRVPAEQQGEFTNGRPFLASCGIYVFDKHALLDVLAQHPRAHDFGSGIIPHAFDMAARSLKRRHQQARRRQERAERAAAAGVPHQAAGGGGGGGGYEYVHPYKVQTWTMAGRYWADVGNSIRTYKEASQHVLLGRGPGDSETPFDTAYHHELIITGAALLPPAQLSPGCRLVRSAVSPGCRVGPGAVVEDSVLGPRAVVGANAVVRNSVVMGADYYDTDMEEGAVLSRYSARTGPAAVGAGGTAGGGGAASLSSMDGPALPPPPPPPAAAATAAAGRALSHAQQAAGVYSMDQAELERRGGGGGLGTSPGAADADPQVPPLGIGAGSVVEGALVDKNARIGTRCVVANRAGVWEAMDRVGVGLCVREGVPIVTKSAVLYEGTEI
ncbi:hypothetical protein HYH02_009784 [Chlamydomonas schloesseri]|uniref:glucose-1-phosphate adenylyltransferase n=1 Tax=Chlamydomonas schloesseri TaxID=2026947 RepID=A0A835TDC2_9CHLO|nr:hypothetical protein HYH02_009784 [Chlamydomonas schloesseri]|eukprot:KAG2441991.1 hypothetical protein HYH02_009784 [Chlamydomonas schloesseri]